MNLGDDSFYASMHLRLDCIPRSSNAQKRTQRGVWCALRPCMCIAMRKCCRPPSLSCGILDVCQTSPDLSRSSIDSYLKEYSLHSRGRPCSPSLSVCVLLDYVLMALVHLTTNCRRSIRAQHLPGPSLARFPTVRLSANILTLLVSLI